MSIRKARKEDLQTIFAIYQEARQFMAENGNPDQWGSEHPRLEILEEDISLGQLYVVSNNHKLCGVFAMMDGEDPTYQYIEDGRWLNEEPYITLHRIASDGRFHGIFKFAIDYCKSLSDNIRIDTHNNNIIMQKQIERNGFRKCGTIYVADGSPRIAYQWVNEE